MRDEMRNWQPSWVSSSEELRAALNFGATT